MEDKNKAAVNQVSLEAHQATKANGYRVKDCGEKVYFEDALNIVGMGKYNYRLLAISIYSLLAATAEMFTIGIVTTAAQCDLDLDVEKKGLIGAIPVLGVVVSAHFWGFLADTRGRRFALIISTTAACIAGLIATFSNNWIFLAIIKFIGAIFASGTNALSFAFIGESTIAPKRQLYLMYASAGVLTFQLINAIMAYPILSMNFSYYMPLLGYTFRPWRLFLMVIGLISGVNMLLIVFFTYESPKFYFAIGEHDKGLKSMQKMYSINTGNAAESYPVKYVVLNDDDYRAKKRSFLRSIWDQTIPLFSKKYIKNTLLVFLCGLPSYCIAPPFSIWLPFIFNSYSETKDSNTQFCEIFHINETQITSNSTVAPECDDKVADLSLIALSSFAVYLTICSLCTALIIKYIGKKWTYVANHFLTSIMCLVINHLELIYGITSLVGMTANVACMGIVTTYAVELFPTYMRAMAVCLCILSGRSVSIIFFNIIGTQLQNNCNNFIYLIAGLIFFGGVVGLFLPSDTPQKKSDKVTKTESNDANENTT